MKLAGTVIGTVGDVGFPWYDGVFSKTSATMAEADENALARAVAIVDAAGYYGWENFDSYPLELTKDEVEARYADQE